MYISIQELQLRKIEFSESFSPGKIDLGTEIAQKEQLTSKGRAELIEEHYGPKQVVRDIRLVGGFATAVELHCARCLEPVALKVAEDFDLLYRPQGANAGRDEISINEADTEIGYYKGEGLLLEDVLKEQLLLAVPFRALCRDDCKGLCSQCGVNLNSSTCDCGIGIRDPRWSALADIKERLKEQ